MSFLRVIKREKVKVTVAVILVLLLAHFLTASYSESSPKTVTSNNGSGSSKPLKGPPDNDNIQGENGRPGSKIDKTILSSIRDYTVFFNDLEDFKINAPSIKDKYYEDKAKEVFSTSNDFLFSKEYLQNILQIPDETFEMMKDSHTRYVDEHINKLIKNYGVATFGNILPTDPEWSTYQGSSGYVMVGGGKYSWLSYLVIKQIRSTGAKLPIELFIATSDEYEKDFCEKILPSLNARCNLFDEKLAKNLDQRFNIGGYQNKMLAIISSKFENVLYVDSDNFPTTNIDYLFESDLYKEKNLILWPDAWARTTNPKYYDIARVPVKENKLLYNAYDKHQKKLSGTLELKPLADFTYKDTWYHTFEGTLPDPSSETGMLMVNRTSHLRTLLLCLYYNVFGPNYYYPIFTQGAAGEGDKETFIAAAHVLKEPWFQTLKQFQWVGYFSENDDKFKSKALGHYDPVQSQKLADGKETDDKIDIIFMHLSYPKYYPDWLVNNRELVYELGKHFRMYEGINENVGYDFDLRVLQFFTQGVCAGYYDSKGKAVDGSDVTDSEYMGKYLLYVSENRDFIEESCVGVFLPHLKWLKETTKY